MPHFAREYGGALFSLAGKEGLTDEIMDQLKAITQVLNANPDYLRLLAAKSLESAKRKELLEEAFGGRIHKYLLSFMKILIDRGTISRFGECVDAYTKLYNEMYNIEAASVVSAVELTDEQKESVRVKLESITGKTIVASYSVDPELIGGLCVDVAGRSYDNSIRARLADMRQCLAGDK